MAPGASSLQSSNHLCKAILMTGGDGLNCSWNLDLHMTCFDLWAPRVLHSCCDSHCSNCHLQQLLPSPASGKAFATDRSVQLWWGMLAVVTLAAHFANRIVCRIMMMTGKMQQEADCFICSRFLISKTPLLWLLDGMVESSWDQQDLHISTMLPGCCWRNADS